MNLFAKLTICFFIISNDIGSLRSRPNDSVEMVRQERQVVQPSWLTRKDKVFIDPKVHVTAENLKETAEIRETIKSAVNAGTYAVDVSQPNVPIPVIQSSETLRKPFGFLKIHKFANKMRIMWQEFLDKSRKLIKI